MELKANVIGGGLAGAEASWQLAERGISVTLYDMKPQKLQHIKQTGLQNLFAQTLFVQMIIITMQ